MDGEPAMEGRVRRLEEGFAEMRGDVHGLRTDVSRIQTDIGQLLDEMRGLNKREASRPEPLSWGKIGATVASTITVIGALWYGVTWAVDHASVARWSAMDLRVARIERTVDLNSQFVETWNKDGRLHLLESRVVRLEQTANWRSTVTQERR